MGNTPSKSGIGGDLAKTTLFEKEANGITYRVPALIYLRHSHTFLAFAEKRSSPSDHDAKILVMRRGTLKADGSVQWSSSQELLTACLPNHRTMNPCPVYEKNSKTLFLLFICIWGNTTETRQVITVYPRSLSIYSEDFGQTWHIGKMLRKKSCECEMAEIIDHEGRSHLYCNARNAGGHRCEALSENSGVYFDKPHMAQELIEPPSGCQGSVVGFPAPEFVPNDDAESKACGTSLLSPDTQTWLLFMHPTNRSSRRDMGVYLNRSPLHSSGWDRPRIIHSGPSGYSDLAYNGDKDQFSCLIECGKESELEQIAFMSFTLNDVMQTGNKKEKKMR
ncbi:sialidase-3-like isoform X2 [Xiphias gladius]|uniref:sialidase-3-like isoform X2 n=1 Tax=Xiphias gladius TaxID=8245 RepID=UPI001A99FECC|nr:sialidase-3-like isoform X2 [Xiphias gladius]